MKLAIPLPAIYGTFSAELDESRNVQVHVFRARARYRYSFAVVKKKITWERDSQSVTRFPHTFHNDA